MVHADGIFRGSTEAGQCPSALRGASYATAEVVVGPEGIDSWDRGYDAAGEQVWGAEKGATSSAAWSRPLSPEDAPSSLCGAGVARVLVLVAREVGREAGVQPLRGGADPGGVDPGAQVYWLPEGPRSLNWAASQAKP